MADKEKSVEFDVKQMLTENAQKGTKIKYNERMEVEIIQDTTFYKKGQILNPHKVKAEALIKQKIAKKVNKD